MVLDLRIISNKKQLLKEEVDMVVLPGYFGDIGINSGDRIYVYLLKPGIIYLFNNNRVSARYFIFNGRFKLDNQDLIVITEGSIINLDDFNTNSLQEQIKKYEEIIGHTTDIHITNYYTREIDNYKEVINSVGVKNYS